jgi:hypothetical protein
MTKKRGPGAEKAGGAAIAAPDSPLFSAFSRFFDPKIDFFRHFLSRKKKNRPFGAFFFGVFFFFKKKKSQEQKRNGKMNNQIGKKKHTHKRLKIGFFFLSDFLIFEFFVVFIEFFLAIFEDFLTGFRDFLSVFWCFFWSFCRFSVIFCVFLGYF